MQTPAPFEYERATSVDHALDLLDRHGPDARLLAGGHSLLPMMKLRLSRPDMLVDINHLPDLGYVRMGNGEIRIGALARHRDILDSAVLAEHFRIFRDAEQVIADPVVRGWGTIGGSLCQADPSEDLSAVCAAAKARFVIRGRAGSRVVPMSEFHVGPYETAVGPAELLVEIRLPVQPGCGSAYEKVKRRAGDWPVAAAGAVVWLEQGVIRDCGIGLTALGAEHHGAPAAEEVLRGQRPTEEALQDTAEAATAACNPASDQRGPAAYKEHLARELTVRALRRAVARAQGQEG